MKKLFLIVLFSSISYPPLLWSQNQGSDKYQKSTLIGVSFDYGYILKHSENLRELDDAFPVGIGLEWSKMLLTKNAWEFCNCLPKIGIELSY